MGLLITHLRKSSTLSKVSKSEYEARFESKLLQGFVLTKYSQNVEWGCLFEEIGGEKNPLLIIFNCLCKRQKKKS